MWTLIIIQDYISLRWHYVVYWAHISSGCNKRWELSCVVYEDNDKEW